MLEWFNTLTWSEQLFWIIAVVSTVVFLIVLIGNRLRIKKIPDLNSGFQIFKLKNCLSFFTIFGWVGIASLYQGFGLVPTLIIAFLSGIVMMFVMTSLFYYVRKMTEGGTLEYKNDFNSKGEVFIEVGKLRSRAGKVKIKIEGILKEMDAVTDFEHDIKTGTLIQVESVTEEGILIIKPLQ